MGGEGGMTASEGLSGACWGAKVAECVNAVRTDPDAFVELFPCDFAGFLENVKTPRRTPLKTRLDVSDGTPQPLDR